MSSERSPLPTRADWSVAREVVVGLTEELLSPDARFWELIGHSRLLDFDEAARRAIDEEKREGRVPGPWGAVERLLAASMGRRE